MRNPIFTKPGQRNEGRQGQALRAAIRQVERAEDYVVAVTNLDISDAEVWRSVGRLRTELEQLRGRLSQLRLAPPQ